MSNNVLDLFGNWSGNENTVKALRSYLIVLTDLISTKGSIKKEELAQAVGNNLHSMKEGEYAEGTKEEIEFFEVLKSILDR